MERRFTRAWEQIEERRQAGESLDEIMARMRTADLIAALAGAGEEHAVAANAIATHLLNRQKRAPYLGAFLVSFTTLIVVLIVDFVIAGGSLLAVRSGQVAQVVAIFSLVVAAFASASFFAMWKGRLPRVRAALSRRRGY